MEFEFSTFLLFLLCFFLFLFLFLFVLQKLRGRPKTTKSSLNLPPGPKRLPFIGNLHNLLSSNPPHHTLRDLANKYGPLMHLQLGEVDTIIISSPEIAKEIFKTHDIIFASRPSLLVTEISSYGNTDIVCAPYGEYWRQLRKICTLELFSARRVQSFQPIREQEFMEVCKWIAMREGSPVNLTKKVSLAYYDIIARAALGKKTNEQATFLATVKEAIELLSAFNFVDLYPSIKLFRVISGLKRKIEELHKKSDRVIENIIADRKRDKAAKIDVGRKHEEDLLDALLKIQEAGSLELPFTTDNVKAVLGDLFGAGIETSTTVVDWAMAEMLKNPRILTKAQNEVRNLFDSKRRRVEESCFDELTYLKLVIKETLRMHPPSPLLIPREPRETCEINGYKIPAKSRVLVNAWAMGRNPNYWEDPERFEPERFLEKSVDYKGSMLEYIPFGAGRRICPGISFGLANVEMPLAMFLYHFDWVLPNGMKPEEMDMRESSGMTTKRREDLCVIPLVRRALPVEFEVK